MPPRVCFVCPPAYGYFRSDEGFTGGGSERQVHLLSTELAETHDVHVVVGDYGQPRREDRESVTLHRAYPLQPRASPLQPIRHLALVGRAMRRADADVYVFRGNPRVAGFVWLLARLLRRPWVYHVANDEHVRSRPGELPRPVGRLFATALRHAAAVVAQTDRQRDILAERYGVDATVVPNGYPQAPDPVPAEAREYLLWVGRLDERQKRPHLFLDLAERLPDVQCRLVGPVDEDEAYQRDVVERARGLDNVVVVGEVPPDKVHGFHRRAIALVDTAAYEGFPNVFLEAWRQATPVASLDVDPGRFLDHDVPSGYAEGSMEELTAICSRLAEEVDHRERAGRAARECFELRYRIETVAERYADVLRGCI